MKRLLEVIAEELRALRPRLLLVQMIAFFLPPPFGSRLLGRMLRWIGLGIGEGSWLMGMPTIVVPANGYGNLQTGPNFRTNVGCHFELGAPITIGKNVALGHEVMLLTTTHNVNEHIYHLVETRLGAPESYPIVIEDGAWLAARVLVLPGVTIGEGAVVAAGSVVVKDIPPHVLAGGTPAKPLRPLGRGEQVETTVNGVAQI